MNTWAIKQPNGQLLNALQAQLMMSDPVKIKNVQGVALTDTRATARTIIERMERKGVRMDGYKPVRVAVRLEVV